MSIKLTDTQLVILSAAAQRDDRCLTAPKGLKGAAAQKLASKLLAAGLVKEIRAKPGMPIWRRDDETAHSFALKLVAAGLKAIAVDEADDEPQTASTQSEPTMMEGSDVSKSAGSAAVSKGAPREGTKASQIVTLLQREDGATLAELVAATGWLPHTTRAALTGLRKRGYPVMLDRSDNERGSAYRIVAESDGGDAKGSSPSIGWPAAPASERAKPPRVSPPRPVAAPSADTAA
jgi:hypothetical protein